MCAPPCSGERETCYNPLKKWRDSCKGSGWEPSVKLQLETMPSELESAMESLITVFHRYASKDGNNATLTRGAFKELMKVELAGFLKSQKDPAAVDNIMKGLDSNSDGVVDFEEFVSLITGLSLACEQCYQMHLMKQAGKK